MPTQALKFFLGGFLFLSSLPVTSANEIIRPVTAQGNLVYDYKTWISNAKMNKGDVIEYPDGSRFEYLGEHHNGETTQVLKVKVLSPKEYEGQVMALRAMREIVDEGWMQKWVLAQGALSGAVRVPKLFHKQVPFFALVEWIENYKRLDELLKNPETWDPKILKEAVSALPELGKEFARVQKVGDFKPSQFVFDLKTRRWVLVDFSTPVFLTSLNWFIGEGPFTNDLWPNYFEVRDPNVPHLSSIRSPTDWEAKIKMAIDTGYFDERQKLVKSSKVGAIVQKICSYLGRKSR